MKIIDLYNQVAKGIQPEKFKYKDRWFAYNVDDKEFRSLQQEIISDYPEYIYLSELIDLSNLNDDVETISNLKTLDKIEAYYDDQEWIKTKSSRLGLFTQAGSKFLLNKLNEVIDYVKEIEKLQGSINHDSPYNCLKYNNFTKMNESLIELVNNNLDLPIFAWVNGEVCKDDCASWLGQLGEAEIREYAKVEPYGWYERDYVFKDDYEDYLDYLLDTNKNLTEEEAKNQILNLDYKKAIFVYIDLPNKF